MKKITYMGETIYERRDSKGRFSSFKSKFVKFVKRVMIWAVIINIGAWALIGAYSAGSQMNPMIVHAEKVLDISGIKYNEKIETLRNDVVAKLQKCESGGVKDPQGLIVFDSNKKASLGSLQFQVTTVIHYYKTLYGKTITNQEAIAIATDDTRAVPLAKDILFSKGAGDWYNCSVKLGLNKEIELIKKLYD